MMTKHDAIKHLSYKISYYKAIDEKWADSVSIDALEIAVRAMANEPKKVRYIDVDYLMGTYQAVCSAISCEECRAKYKDGTCKLEHWLKAQPTIDAVEVVRCKDCKHSVDYYHDGECYCLKPERSLEWFGGSWDFYCADGKRKEKTDETN